MVAHSHLRSCGATLRQGAHRALWSPRHSKSSISVVGFEPLYRMGEVRLQSRRPKPDGARCKRDGSLKTCLRDSPSQHRGSIPCGAIARPIALLAAQDAVGVARAPPGRSDSGGNRTHARDTDGTCEQAHYPLRHVGDYIIYIIL